VCEKPLPSFSRLKSKGGKDLANCKTAQATMKESIKENADGGILSSRMLIISRNI
jgi:hypothetical protein